MKRARHRTEIRPVTNDPGDPAADLRLAYLSCHFSGAIKLDFLLSRGVRPAAIITIDPAMAARHDVAGYHDFAPLARRHRIPLHRLADFRFTHTRDRAFMRARHFDILLISGWQRIVPATVLEELGIGAVGEHGSSEYLPRGRGRSPVNWSLIRNRRRYVVHLFMANPEADAGALIDYEVLTLNCWDDVRTVYAKAALSSGKLFLRNLPALRDGSWRPRAQAPVPATWLPKRGRADDIMDWKAPTLDLFNLVRGITRPYPGAFTRLEGREVSIWRAQPFDYEPDDFTARPGEVLAVFPDGSAAVKTVDGVLLLTEYSAFRRLRAGDRFR